MVYRVISRAKEKGGEGETDRQKVVGKVLMGQLGREVMRVPRGTPSCHLHSTVPL